MGAPLPITQAKLAMPRAVSNSPFPSEKVSSGLEKHYVPKMLLPFQ